MRVIVCGGRNYHDYEKICASLDQAHAKRPITILIEGGAKGADAHAATWADNNGIFRVTGHANWRKFNGGAGPRRNQDMINLLSPYALIAFKGGKGTADMISRARKAELVVWEVK